MSQYYSLRLDERDGVSRDRVIDFCRKGSYDEYVVVHEVASVTGKPHFQGYIKTDVKPQAYQKRVIAAFPELVARGGSGKRGGYSAAAIKDIEAYRRYIMKGTSTSLPVVIVSSIQLSLEELWSEARKVEDKKAQRAASGDDESIFGRGVAHFRDVAKNWSDCLSQDEKHREVCRWLLRDYVERKKAPNDYLIRSYITGILNVVDEASFDYCVRRIVDKLL